MPPPSTAQQKVFITQFVSLTGASERQATRYLKSTGFKINEAVDASCPSDAHAFRCSTLLQPPSSEASTASRLRRHSSAVSGLAGATLLLLRRWAILLPDHRSRLDTGHSSRLSVPLSTGMMGWKGLGRRLPSKVTPFWSSSRKAERKQGTAAAATSANATNDYHEGFYAAGNEPKTSALEAKLESLFDSLRDDDNDEKDKLELDSTMGYLSNKLKANLENAELFLALDLIQAPSVGEITRKGYVGGWKATGVGATHQEHAAHLKKLKSSLSTDTALFKKVYRYTFVAGREGDQKALSLENALIYWGMLFTPPGMAWRTPNHDWLELWMSFLNEKWTRSVNKDMWNMTLEFAVKAMADETLSFWSEDGAWPSVIDDFVEWCRVKGITKSESMDVDADA